MVYPHIAYCGPAYPDQPRQSDPEISRESDAEIIRELDSRTSDGIHVRLLWHPADDHVSVAVRDTKTGDEFEVPVASRDRARDVYHHPYAYAYAISAAA